MEQAPVDGLDADDGGGAEDIVRAGTAGYLGGGLAQSGEDLAEGVGAGEKLHEFEGDVARIEIGENEDVGASADGALHALDAGDGEVEGGVHLDFALDFELEVKRFGLGAGELGGVADFYQRGLVGGALGGVAEHGDARHFVGEVAGDAGGGEGDVAELLGGGIGDDAAIREEKGAVGAHFFLVEIENHQRGGMEHAGQTRDDLENGPEGAGGAVGGAGDESVGLAGGDHHGGEVAIVFHGGAGLGEFEALDAAELFELDDKGVEILAAFGLDDANALEVNVEFGGRLLDGGAVAEQDGHAHAAGHPLAGGLQDTRIGALGENDAFGMALKFLGEFGDERHGVREAR